MSTENVSISQRVKSLRQWMKDNNLFAYVIPTIDPHNSEYLPDHWKTREWLTGFTGSAGLAVVTLKAAALWTDSRYFLQAEEQLQDTPFELMRDGNEGVPTPCEWLKETLDDEYDVVGYCGEMMPQDMFEEMCGKYSFEMSDVGEDPFNVIWTDRPGYPSGKITIQPLSAAGESVADKLQAIRHSMNGSVMYDGFFFNDISEIAWILNLRGEDIEYNPFFLSYLLVKEDSAILFVDANKFGDDVKDYLEKEGIIVKGYERWQKYFERMVNEDAVFVAVPDSISRNVIDYLEDINVEFDLLPSPVPMLRAIKNDVEQEGFRRAMEYDGVAMVKFLRWLDENVAKGDITEMGVDRKLTAFRAEQPGFSTLSFGTIAAYADHGAIVHYEAEPETDVTLQPKGLLLLDSGAHYQCGTTDITRTIALGELTEEERRVYTLVLKGHIGLARCRFPEGATGLQLDTAARYAMWQAGYDFGHGTGHGVGSRLGVHEGPHQIRKNSRSCTLVPFHAGMTITDEPGIYVTGRFGVRIENVLLAQPSLQTDFGKFLEFETLTLCPYDMRPVEKSMLSADEIQWINDYHARVRERLMPKLDDEADRQWLEAATMPI